MRVKRKKMDSAEKLGLAPLLHSVLVFLVYSVGSGGSELETMANSRLRVCQAYKMERVALGTVLVLSPHLEVLTAFRESYSHWTMRVTTLLEPAPSLLLAWHEYWPAQ